MKGAKVTYISVETFTQMAKFKTRIPQNIYLYSGNDPAQILTVSTKKAENAKRPIKPK